MDANIYNRIWAENEAFMKLKVFYDQEYFQFIRDYVHSYKQLQPQKEGIQENFNQELSQSRVSKRMKLLSQQYKTEMVDTYENTEIN